MAPFERLFVCFCNHIPVTETGYHVASISVVLGLYVKRLHSNLKAAIPVILQIPVIPFLYFFKPYLSAFAFMYI